MKKLLVALTGVIFVVALALPAMAGYHQVYEFDPIYGWIDEPDGHCEMFSKTPKDCQYSFKSDPRAVVCSDTYWPPIVEAPVQVDIANYLHLFPYIEWWINETELIWDVFKPGNYMAKAFVIKLKANCPVHVHFGTFENLPVPDGFADGQDGMITWHPETKTGDDNAFDNKQREYSMLGKELPGTPPDVIDVWWWWCDGSEADWINAHIMTNVVPDKGDIGPSPSGPFPTQWVPAPAMNCDYTVFQDTEDLHFGEYITFYEDIYVEDCDSEGKYIDKFAITIVPDP